MIISITFIVHLIKIKTIVYGLIILTYARVNITQPNGLYSIT